MNRIAILASALVVTLSHSASAGVFSDDLTKCLVTKTTDTDRADLVRWLFATMALHPDVKTLATVSDEQRAEATKKAANLFERLVTESCKAEFRAAAKNEGQAAIVSSFQALGNVAGMALMQHPDVAKAAAELNSFVDQSKIENALKGDS